MNSQLSAPPPLPPLNPPNPPPPLTSSSDGRHQNVSGLVVVAVRIPSHGGKDGGKEHKEHDEDERANKAHIIEIRGVAPPVVVEGGGGPLPGGGVDEDEPLNGDDALDQDDAQRNQEQGQWAGQASVGEKKKKKPHWKVKFEIFNTLPTALQTVSNMYVRSSGQGATVCKPRATHRVLNTCNVSCAM